MNDREFDDLARRALASDHVANEDVWRRSIPRGRPPRWVPGFGEMLGATGVALACLAGLVLVTAPKPMPAHEPIVLKDSPPALSKPESAFYAVSQMAGSRTR